MGFGRRSMWNCLSILLVLSHFACCLGPCSCLCVNKTGQDLSKNREISSSPRDSAKSIKLKRIGGWCSGVFHDLPYGYDMETLSTLAHQSTPRCFRFDLSCLIPSYISICEEHGQIRVRWMRRRSIRKVLSKQLQVMATGATPVHYGDSLWYRRRIWSLGRIAVPGVLNCCG